MSSALLNPQVIDATTLGPRRTQPLFLPVAAEGRAFQGGTAAQNELHRILRPSEADALFGAGSPLAITVNFLLGRGVSPVLAMASKKDSGVNTDPPTLTQRQAAWEEIASDRNVRIIVTDSTATADHDALATVCEQAEGLNHKVFCVVGMPVGTTKAALQSSAGAIASKRAVLVGPGLYDETGVLRSGIYSAWAVAAQVATNPNIADDMDTAPLFGFTGIEKNAQGRPLFRTRLQGGVVVDDHEDLLQSGVSPLGQSREGGVEIRHLRTTFTADTTHDALMTLLIRDQVFIDVRDYVENSGYLREGNTQTTRDRIQSGVEALLTERAEWIEPLVQADGTEGYNVQVMSSADERQIIVAYEGEIVRGVSTILVAGRLQITV